MVTAPGYQTIVTHTFVGNDKFIEDDTVFGVKQSLVAPFEQGGGETEWRSEFDFIMVPQSQA